MCKYSIKESDPPNFMEIDFECQDKIRIMDWYDWIDIVEEHGTWECPFCGEQLEEE